MPFVKGKLTLNRRESQQSKFNKLFYVSHYLRIADYIGALGDNKSFFSGTCDMRFGIVYDYESGIAFFGGKQEGNFASLIGSRHSLIGSAPEKEVSDHTGYYYTLKFLNRKIDNALEPTSSQDNAPDCHSYAKAMEIALKAVPHGFRKYEYLAVLLYSEPKLVIATPIYVALADTSEHSAEQYIVRQPLLKRLMSKFRTAD